MNRRRARQVVAALLIVAAAWFLARAIIVNWAALREFDWHLRPVLLAASIAAHVGVLGWGVWVWSRVLQHFRAPHIGFTRLLRIWFLSNLARYIPGKVFQFLAVVQLGRGTGMPSDTLLASLVVHTGLALLSAVLLSAWTLTGALFPDVPARAISVLVLIGSAALVHPGVLNRGLALGSRVLRRPLLTWHGSWLAGLRLLLLSVVSWSLYGIAYTLLIVSLTPVPVSALPVLAGVNALSFVAGYLAIVSPGGLGVREAAMTGLLLPLLPTGVAALLAVASRLWTIAAELIGALLVLGLARRSGAVVEEVGDPLSRVP